MDYLKTFIYDDLSFLDTDAYFLTTNDGLALTFFLLFDFLLYLSFSLISSESRSRSRLMSLTGLPLEKLVCNFSSYRSRNLFSSITDLM